MRKKIFRNWSLKLISLILATLLWILVVQMGDPPDEKDMGNIQVKLTNTELLERENKVYEILDNSDTVRVTVYAPGSVFERLRSSDIVAEADVSRLTDINTVPIKFSTSVPKVLSIEGSREAVKLDVEDKASKYVSLVSSTIGEVAEGYMVTGITPDQNRIEVSGPKSAVEKVKYAGVEIDVTDATSNLTANIDIKLYDAEDNPVEHVNLKKNVDYVRLSVEVLAVKDVPIEMSYTGEPAEGYMATGVVEYEPTTVKIAGSAYALSRINAITVPEERLDISGVDSNLEEYVDIREYLPDNIKLAETSFYGRIAVTVYIEPIEKKTLQIPEQNIALINVPAGFSAEKDVPEEGFYVLEVEGLSRQIDPLQQESVTGVVDIAAWMQGEQIGELKPGVHGIPVTFALDERILIDTPLRARVTIEEIDND